MRGVRGYLAGSIVLGALGALAACSGGNFFAEREPWRHAAEVKCINSGALKEGAGIVRAKAIQGPGICGADFPLRVSVLGESAAALGYVGELRPPGSIPNAAPAQPRWPTREPPPAPYESPYEPRQVIPSELPPYDPRAVQPAPRYDARGPYDRPLSLDPPGSAGLPAREPYDFRRPYGAPPPPARAPVSGAPIEPRSSTYDLSPEPYDRRRVIDEPRPVPGYDPPPYQTARPPVRASRPPGVPLGPTRAPPPVTGSIGAVSVTPAATLACPIVSALDQWIAGAVQPAAMRWFGQPVAEIKQISAYSCRGMNGNPHARISEHAFGNALDIASFTLADGRKITVKDGWRGLPEEQGFLRDVQAAACDQFTTVLAPGSNVYHYDHIHVDLMRRGSGHRACNPHAVSGEEVAARARAVYAARRGDPAFTGSVGTRRPQSRAHPTAFAEEPPRLGLPIAVPGDDGED